MPQPAITAISPFFIVSNVTRTIAFYRERLGFECTYRQPKADAFFAILRRGGAQLFVKSEQGITPLPNSSRHPHMRWDAYLFAPAPDHLAAEFQAHGSPSVLPSPIPMPGCAASKSPIPTATSSSLAAPEPTPPYESEKKRKGAIAKHNPLAPLHPSQQAETNPRLRY